MEENEKKLEKNSKRNDIFLTEFSDYLKKSDVTDKTIRKHISNINFYLNNFLTYYEDFIVMEDGVNEVDNFLGDFFIRKCLWASKTSIKEYSASLKKFYKCMLENKHIEEQAYKDLCDEIKQSMDYWLESLDDFDNGNYFAW